MSALWTTLAKATYATVVAALGSLSTVLIGPGASFTHISSAQWVTVALAALLAGGGVYGITNRVPSSGSGGGTSSQ